MRSKDISFERTKVRKVSAREDHFRFERSLRRNEQGAVTRESTGINAANLNVVGDNQESTLSFDESDYTVETQFNGYNYPRGMPMNRRSAETERILI